MYNFVWFSSRIKVYNILLGQLDFLDQNIFIVSKSSNFIETKIVSNNSEKRTKESLIPLLNMEWNCNQKIELCNIKNQIKITLRKENYLFFLENCINFLVINSNFASILNCDFFISDLTYSKSWENYSNHVILSNFIFFSEDCKDDVSLYVHGKNINNLSFLTFNWFPKIL